MKRVLILLLVILISACASNNEVEGELELPEILELDGKNFAAIPSIESKELSISRPEGKEFVAKALNEIAPDVEIHGFYCSLINPGVEALKNADIVLELNQVREAWVPIDGKPKKIYIFDVKFNNKWAWPSPGAGGKPP